MNCCHACGALQNAVTPEAAVGDLSVSLYGDCWWNGKRVRLTRTELVFVHAMATDPDCWFKPEALLNLSGSVSEGNKVAEVVICRIRKKMLEVDPDFNRIESRRGAGRGYRWRTARRDVLPTEIRLITNPV